MRTCIDKFSFFNIILTFLHESFTKELFYLHFELSFVFYSINLCTVACFQVLLNNTVQLNYHLLYYCLDHAEFNQYLVTLLKTTGNISSEQFQKHFFQLGLYSGFVKRDEERYKRLKESSRKVSYTVLIRF